MECCPLGMTGPLHKWAQRNCNCLQTYTSSSNFCKHSNVKQGRIPMTTPLMEELFVVDCCWESLWWCVPTGKLPLSSWWPHLHMHIAALIIVSGKKRRRKGRRRKKGKEGEIRVMGMGMGMGYGYCWKEEVEDKYHQYTPM